MSAQSLSVALPISQRVPQIRKCRKPSCLPACFFYEQPLVPPHSMQR